MPGEVSLIVGHHNAFVGEGSGGQDRVECASRFSGCCATGHELRPDEASAVIESQNAASEQSLRSLGAGEPFFQLFAFIPGWLFQDAPLDFCDGQRRNE